VDGPAAPVDVEAALARVRRRLADPDVAVEPTPRPALTVVPGGAARAGSRRTTGPATLRPAWAARSRWLAGGAGLAAAAALAVTLVRRAAPADDAAPLRYATATGQRTTVRLPDGTRVVLGPSSTLSAVGAYGRSARILALQGEAFFEVTHDASRPFIVRAGPAVVRDLGTAFVVRAGAATGRTTVAVTQGSVALGPADSSAAARSTADTASVLMLRAGDRGLVDRPVGASTSVAYRARRLPASGAGGTPATSTADDLAWTTGRLVFRDAPLAEVADGLRRWYGLTLRVTDPALAGRTLTASFQGESADEVVRVVTLALGARAERRGDTVVVRTVP
jgi:transmembrane sensor